MRSSLMIFIIIILINAVNSLSVSFEAIKEHHYADIYCIAKYDKCTTHCKGLSEPYLSPCFHTYIHIIYCIKSPIYRLIISLFHVDGDFLIRYQ
ncbi:unnamed protein product [Rhizophagus irregularis]|nr:unnamed protein product [Rhizophagus irregularis]